MKHNVLQLIGSFHQGGSEQQALRLIQSLHSSGRYRVRVACLNPQGILRQEVEQLNLGEISEYPLTSFYDRNAITQIRRFAAELREGQIDLVQSHDFYTNVFGMVGAALARTPVRIAAKRETGEMRSGAQRAAELVAFKLAHAVVANAEAVKEFLIVDGVPAAKVVTIYNGVDAQCFAPRGEFQRADILNLLGLPREGRRFVSIVANLRHTVKDHPTFLRAAKRVRENVADAAFIIAGEGELLEPMRALATGLGLGAEVFFIGRCKRISELLAVSEICVLSSLAEGFSNAILEYMAAGRPVVATDVGGARELVIEGTTGFLVPPRDFTSMGDRITQLLNDVPRAQHMGEQGRRLVVERFSREAQLKRTEQLYEDLLNRKR